jgi:hypothetical protein
VQSGVAPPCSGERRPRRRRRRTLEDRGVERGTCGYRPAVTTLLEYTRTEFPHHTVEVCFPNGRTTVVLASDDDASRRGGATRPSRPPERAAVLGRPGPARNARLDNGSSSSAAAPGDGGLTSEGVALVELADHTVIAHVVGADAAVAMLRRMHDAGWERTAAVLVRPVEPAVVSHRNENTESVTDLPDRRIVVIAALGAAVGAVAVGLVGWLVGDDAATGFVSAGLGAILGAVIGGMLGGFGRHAGEQAWSQPHAPGRTMGVVATFVDDEGAVTDAVHEMERGEHDAIRVVNAQGAWRAPIA